MSHLEPAFDLPNFDSVDCRTGETRFECQIVYQLRDGTFLKMSDSGFPPSSPPTSFGKWTVRTGENDQLHYERVTPSGETESLPDAANCVECIERGTGFALKGCWGLPLTLHENVGEKRRIVYDVKTGEFWYQWGDGGGRETFLSAPDI
uniref:Uncharacterized protein n=1 Tax=Chromera velia CCMP2878 TaxID=1169474 RepID=A0A0G4IFK4_9ALVE|eukprot:Cvel_13942.t1-p1 / transcript=Cvel_13942.t1 / gene=Cvel_13942 / organism=Chromera_velia_CCMP2878 / gene_product=hypothetical protein / transcript_product=hypothetical protein / location=Cvel_scaffold973:42227-42670(+) / protein_length=148 / sequence_SO=supercontig / SO=protein_coding / is_pseudo=false